jgi:NAD(P)-dependent dehydrogenase (short-subunit alcohol dehydrogenase family)
MDKPTAIVVGVGAEQGVGGAVCRRFASEGYHVYVAGRTEAKIAKVVDTIAKAGGARKPSRPTRRKNPKSSHCSIAHSQRQDVLLRIWPCSTPATASA